MNWEFVKLFFEFRFDLISFGLGIASILLIFLFIKYIKSFQEPKYSVPHLKATVESIHMKLQSINKELNTLYSFFNEVGRMEK